VEKFLEFREAFWKSGTVSVDAFLEGRPEFLDVGKFAIAYCLIPFESEANLFTPPGDHGDWYGYLSERLNRSFDEFEHNKLSIVTFNYDHSLEHYLFTSLLNWHGRSVDDCIGKFAKLPIIHVYGQLGKSRIHSEVVVNTCRLAKTRKRCPLQWSAPLRELRSFTRRSPNYGKSIIFLRPPSASVF